MNDVKDLLERALNDGPTARLATRPETDPTGDLLRGRARLRRRRTTGFAGAAAVALGLAVVPLSLGGHDAATTALPTPTRSVTSLPRIELAAYTGKQVPGYKVAWMPKGWVIQGGTPAHLTIAPGDAKNQDPSSFEGKLMLGLVWDGFTPITGSQAKRDGLTPQSVDGRPGWLSVAPARMTAAEAEARKSGKAGSGETYIPYMTLTYQDGQGQWLYIQVPRSVGWSGGAMAKFASGVTVLKNAAQPS